MIKSFTFYVIFLFFGLGHIGAHSQESQRIYSLDCQVSFVVPRSLEYIEVQDSSASGPGLCYIAFNYKDSIHHKSFDDSIAAPEDWRAQTDFSLTVRSVPVATRLEKNESPDGAAQRGKFKLTSREEIKLSGGEMYVIAYSALVPTESMVRLKQSKETVFLAGNEVRSIESFLYSSKASSQDKARVLAIKKLFSSFDFDQP